MAYASGESGQNEVYVRPFPELNRGKWQVSTSGGSSPLWSPDGRELFYLSNENSVMATAVATKPTFSLGTPKALFRSIYVPANTTNSGTPWDISPDGKRFLMMKEAGSAGGPRKINIVLNWLEELKQRVPEMIGKTRGHYRVGEQLGRGGMGEVYLADDLNLNRKVALKFLPEAFTGDPERMARFEREAKLPASLNHP